MMTKFAFGENLLSKKMARPAQQQPTRALNQTKKTEREHTVKAVVRGEDFLLSRRSHCRSCVYK